jgi:PQQ-like domain
MKASQARSSPGKSSYNLEELTIWRTKISRVKHAVLPASNNRPNPKVSDKHVFVSIFSPGTVCALERRTGQIVWRQSIPGLCAASLHLDGGKLYCQSANTLYQLCPETGEKYWSFCPHGADRETIYSSPVIHGDQLFIGDRAGFLNCLDTDSGKVIWRQMTNDSGENLNSTPIIVKGRVITATNSRTALAFTHDGKLEWKTELDGPSVLGLFAFQGTIGVAADSLYLLDGANGRVRQRFHWSGDQVAWVESSQREIVVQLRGCWPPTGGSNLMTLNKSKVLRRSYRQGSCSVFRYARETGFMYESHLAGINIFRPQDIETVCEIRMENHNNVGLVEVKHRTIYALTGNGLVYALRHPLIKVPG